MERYIKQVYNREYNKKVYKVVKVYIPATNYESIKKHSEIKGYDSMSGYIKSLIDTDMKNASGGGNQKAAR